MSPFTGTIGVEYQKDIVKKVAKAAVVKRKEKARLKKIQEDIAMKYQSGKTMDAADKELRKVIKEPQRGDFPKGKAGDIKYKVAYRKYMEKIA